MTAPDPDDARTQARAELERLAAEGAARGDAAAAKRRDATARKAARARAEDRANLREAVLGGSGAFVATIIVSTLLGGGGGAALIALAGERAWMLWLGVAAIVLGGGIAWCSRYVIGARAILAERQFVANLGFPFDGYFRVLSANPQDGRLALRIEFAGDPPPPETVDGLVKLADGEVGAGKGDRLVVRSRELSSDGGDGPSHNRAFYGWLHRATTRVLLPLHRGYPIARVTVTRD